LLKTPHSSISKYLNEKQFKIVNGDLNCDDYHLIFSVYDLYEGTISKLLFNIFALSRQSKSSFKSLIK